ncbi:MATE family efflux transporter [Pseudovibrio exalbescens]|uniref:MATE family efflux transporter n=1 Tax=Pseudovibrio exalbescens TaxID=197461 RepID=UPI0023656F38|nr:MATE family efflux transporter [Pseudovibrio exalbescens]MDD7908729.1 MATE family efflux transporter [Pseudovibrio exalbescens]
MSNNAKITTAEPFGLFARFAVPAILGLIAVQSAFMVDGIFVGNYVGPIALAAINLMLPFFALFMGVTIMLVVGAAVICGKFLGERKTGDAAQVFTKAFISVQAFAFLFMVLCFFGANTLAGLLGADGDVSSLVVSYIRVVALFLPLFAASMALCIFVRVDGRPGFALGAMLSGAALNVVLDALLIAWLDMGIVGAALATGIAQVLATAILATHLLRKQSLLRFVKPKGSWRVIGRAAFNGLSEFVNESSAGVVAFVFNWILMLEYGAEGVAAFTIVNYILFLGIMVFYGVSEALGPLVSINYGARLPERILTFLGFGVATNVLAGLCIIVLLLSVPEVLVGVFLRDGSTQTLDLTLGFIAVVWPVFLFNGINIALSGYFTGMQCAGQSAVVAALRALVLPVPLIFIAAYYWGPTGAFVALPLAEAMTLGIALLMLWSKLPKRLVGSVAPAAA